MQNSIVETLQAVSIPLFWLSVAGFVTAYAIAVFRAVLQKPARALASFVASFFL